MFTLKYRRTIVPDSIASHVSASHAAESGSTLAESSAGRRGRAFEFSLCGLYAGLLALLTSRHILSSDEMQAWLIARDSQSIPNLLHNMRYEGHPVLWQLLLYIPAHISWNPVSLQIANYILSIAEVWLIVSARKLHWSVRALIPFSFFFFYRYGMFARNYMLAVLMLTAAARCIVATRQRPRLAILFLALATFSHVLAIPIVAALGVLLFWPPASRKVLSLRALWRDSHFRAACLIFPICLLAVYFSVGPPAGASIYAPQYDSGRRAFAHYLVLTGSHAWEAFVPPDRLAIGIADRMGSSTSFALAECAASALLLLLLTATLRSARARVLFLITVSLELLALAVTVHKPDPHHLGFLFVAYFLALLADVSGTVSPPARFKLPRRPALAVILVVLGLQVEKTYSMSRQESAASGTGVKAVSDWLVQSGLSANPIVLQRYAFSTVVVGYTRRATAYYPACPCLGSFVVWSPERDYDREVSAAELRAVFPSPARPILLVSGFPLSLERTRDLHMRLLRTFSGTEIRWQRSRSYQTYIYEQDAR